MHKPKQLDKGIVEMWWNSVKDNQYWSGSIVNLTWNQLWDEAKEELYQIANKLEELNHATKNN